MKKIGENNNIIDNNDNNGPTLKERFELLIKARNFHYENYNKWMTYFYVSISALLLAFIAVTSKSESEVQNKKLIEVSLLLLVYIISILWYWSCKGYYYWNINFISLINFYETEVFKWKKEERIYNVFYNKTIQNNYGSPISGANISTSKVAILFSYIVTNFTGFLFFSKCFYTAKYNQYLIIIVSLLLTIILLFILSIIIPKYFLYSKIDDMPELIENRKLTT